MSTHGSKRKKKKPLANWEIEGSLLDLVKLYLQKIYRLLWTLWSTVENLEQVKDDRLFFDFELEMYWLVPYGWEGERIYDSHYMQAIGLFT